MRTLKFIVNDQTITKDPNCNFDGLVPGSEGYLQAEFSFSPEWKGSKKVVAFYSRFGKEYPPQLLEDGKTCIIPPEALTKAYFKIQVHGRKAGVGLVTNKLEIHQNGGK